MSSSVSTEAPGSCEDVEDHVLLFLLFYLRFVPLPYPEFLFIHLKIFFLGNDSTDHQPNNHHVSP